MSTPIVVSAGINCLTSLSRYYFSNQRITRTANLGYFYSNNLSAPSADIELNFLISIHSMIVKEKINGLQIRVLSDAFTIKALLNVEPRSVMFADYYIFVIDDIAKVYHK